MANNNTMIVAMRRLKNEGRSEAYKEFSQRVLDAKVPKDVAWKVALFAYCPANGGTPELFGDPLFAEIAADWRNGRYEPLGEPPGFWKFPDGMGLPEYEPRENPSASVSLRKSSRKVLSYADFENLIPAQKTATKREIMQWAFHHAAAELNEMDPESAPCRGCTTVLRLAKEDYRTFVDRWLKDEEKSAGPQELSDDCRSHLERCEMYEAYLRGERESVFPDANSANLPN